MRNIKESNRETILTTPYLYVIISFLVLDFFRPNNSDSFVDKLLTSLFFITCTWATNSIHQKPTKSGYILGLVLIIVTWFFPLFSYRWLFTVQKSVTAIFIIYTAFRTIKSVLISKDVDLNVVLGSIAGYILIGYIGALLFMIIENLVPNSFTSSDGSSSIHYIYYSFVTLTSLGYGDILPLSNIAKTTSVYLCVIGQFYLTILVAIIVGKFRDSNSNRNNKIID